VTFQNPLNILSNTCTSQHEQKRVYYAQISVWTCELSYGADTMFHRTYFLFKISLNWYVEKRLVLAAAIAPDRRFDYKCCQMLLFACPTTWLPEHVGCIWTPSSPWTIWVSTWTLWNVSWLHTENNPSPTVCFGLSHVLTSMMLLFWVHHYFMVLLWTQPGTNAVMILPWQQTGCAM